MSAGYVIDGFTGAAPEVDRDILVLGLGEQSLIGVDLTTGAMVRAIPPCTLPDVEPFDVVGATVIMARGPADPTQPESVEMVDEPDVIGTMDWRSAEYLLRPLLHPLHYPILGFVGQSAQYWALDGLRPSVGILDTTPHLIEGPYGLACRFLWNGLVHELPITDRRLWPYEPAMGRNELAERLGHPAGRILVALTPPHDGHCYKVVAGLLPG